jgi:hypothetical protein
VRTCSLTEPGLGESARGDALLGAPSAVFGDVGTGDDGFEDGAGGCLADTLSLAGETGESG